MIHLEKPQHKNCERSSYEDYSPEVIRIYDDLCKAVKMMLF